MIRRAARQAARLLLSISVALAGFGLAKAQSQPDPRPEVPHAAPGADPRADPRTDPPAEGRMTLARLTEIVARLDPAAEIRPNGAEFTVEEPAVLLVADPMHNRMRLLVPIKPAEDLTPDELIRLAQANFDTALDARYAVARGILWAAYIHPLSELHDRQFVAAVGQTVNAARSYGTSYSSGLLSYRGGDSGALIQRRLIDELLRRAEDI